MGTIKTTVKTDAAPSRRRVDLEIPANPSELVGARCSLDVLGASKEVADASKLLLTELLTNSIKHSGLRPSERIRIKARSSGEALRVDVYDSPHGASIEPLAGSIRPDPSAESGWGLFLIQRIASRWGSTPGHYWFELSIGDHQDRGRSSGIGA